MSGNVAALPALLEATLAAGVEARFEVDGRSMLPFIRPGDAVRVRPVGGSTPRIGDVVATRGAPHGNLLVHRVIGRREDRLTIRGDNSPGRDGEYSADEILGVVTLVERNGRAVWFGAGRSARLVSWAVRHGNVYRLNRLFRLMLRTP